MPYHEELFISRQAVDQAHQKLLAARETDRLAWSERLAAESSERAMDRIANGPSWRTFIHN